MNVFSPSSAVRQTAASESGRCSVTAAVETSTATLAGDKASIALQPSVTYCCERSFAQTSLADLT